MALSPTARVKARADVLSRVLDGEAVLLDLASGTYFGLNDVGSHIWTTIAEGTTVQALRAAILADYDVDEETVDRDLAKLIDELERRQLIDVSR